MYQVIIVIHVLLGIGIIGLILMQQGKGADAGAAFGTGASGSVFGAQGAASFLSRTTAILAALFFTTSLGLAVLNGQKGVPDDLMSTPAVEQDTLGLPEVGGSIGVDSIPVTPELKSEEVPTAAPDVSVTKKPVEPATGTQIEPTQVPKAEKMKTVKEQSNSGSSGAKEAVKK
ncbi:MAG: preprotein translocase subunit SecG [Methylococcales bacterium]|nr:preprotein translocase subunit SecG [Methylococcales bacterium]